MKSNYLLVVEGHKTEQNIFGSILRRYGYNVITPSERLKTEELNQFNEFDFDNQKNNVIIIQGPKNRIHDLLLDYVKNEISFEKMLRKHGENFQGIFFLYDVDHNSFNDVKEMYNKLQDESSGMLLLSSPCIEVLADYNLNRIEEKYYHLKEYKKDLNIYYENLKTNVVDYIVNNFEKLSLYYLEKNKKDFNELNIMEHPRLIVEQINKLNDRINFSGVDKEKSYVIYRYYSTVAYVFIAFINGLTREIDNYDIFKKWLIEIKSQLQ